MKLHSSVQIFEALQDEKVVDFVKKSLLASYSNLFVPYTDEIEQKISKSFQLLVEAARGNDFSSLKKAVEYIHIHIFGAKNPKSWFYVLYRNYKIMTRSHFDYKAVSQYINGTVLDFGCNGGYYAFELKRHGFDVTMTDVLDYRDNLVKDIPFKLMESPCRIPFSKKKFDTTIIKTVFHHINDENLHKILFSLRTISDRLIIKEDIFGVSKKTFEKNKIIQTDHDLQTYVDLGSDRQYRVLVLVDFFGNVIAHGLNEMVLPYNFKTIDVWKKLLYEYGFETKEVIWYGFDKNEKLHQNFQAWLICDKKK